MLLFVVDASGSDGRYPWKDLQSLIKELGLYDRSLLSRPSLVFSNKNDLRGIIFLLLPVN
jgi:GTPase involved in cell partitioning and DNA repair